MPDEADEDFVGAVVVVGISHVGKDGSERREQYAGTIDRFVGDGDEAGVVLICHDGVERAVPWDPDNLSEVEPGTYRLNDDGAVVRDPDYIMQFVVHEDSE
jgi:hypothetical protein